MIETKTNLKEGIIREVDFPKKKITFIKGVTEDYLFLPTEVDEKNKLYCACAIYNKALNTYTFKLTTYNRNKENAELSDRWYPSIEGRNFIQSQFALHGSGTYIDKTNVQDEFDYLNSMFIRDFDRDIKIDDGLNSIHVPLKKTSEIRSLTNKREINISNIFVNFDLSTNEMSISYTAKRASGNEVLNRDKPIKDYFIKQYLQELISVESYGYQYDNGCYQYLNQLRTKKGLEPLPVLGKFSINKNSLKHQNSIRLIQTFKGGSGFLLKDGLFYHEKNHKIPFDLYLNTNEKGELISLLSKTTFTRKTRTGKEKEEVIKIRIPVDFMEMSLIDKNEMHQIMSAIEHTADKERLR